MCKFCEKIYANYRELDDALYDYEHEVWQTDTEGYRNGKYIIAGICKNEDKLELHIPCDDDFYDPCIRGIKFCPICGRKL